MEFNWMTMNSFDLYGKWNKNQIKREKLWEEKTDKKQKSVVVLPSALVRTNGKIKCEGYRPEVKFKPQLRFLYAYPKAEGRSVVSAKFKSIDKRSAMEKKLSKRTRTLCALRWPYLCGYKRICVKRIDIFGSLIEFRISTDSSLC